MSRRFVFKFMGESLLIDGGGVWCVVDRYWVEIVPQSMSLHPQAPQQQ